MTAECYSNFTKGRLEALKVTDIWKAIVAEEAGPKTGRKMIKQLILAQVPLSLS
jgi:hypothetical protein